MRIDLPFLRLIGKEAFGPEACSSLPCIVGICRVLQHTAIAEEAGGDRPNA